MFDHQTAAWSDEEFIVQMLIIPFNCERFMEKFQTVSDCARFAKRREAYRKAVDNERASPRLAAVHNVKAMSVSDIA